MPLIFLPPWQTYYGLEPNDTELSLLKEKGKGFVQVLCLETKECKGPWPTSKVTNVFYRSVAHVHVHLG
jgi:hypothetical protein